MGMRTTLALDNDAIEAVRAYARANRKSLGNAASELIRRGARYQLPIIRVNGLPVLAAPEGFPKITSEQVRDLLADE
jgi:hypothetical protein